jgi:hypothetical protein
MAPPMKNMIQSLALIKSNYGSDTICWRVRGSVERNNELMLQDHKRVKCHISTQNLEELGSWITSLIYPTFFPFTGTVEQ